MIAAQKAKEQQPPKPIPKDDGGSGKNNNTTIVTSTNSFSSRLASARKAKDISDEDYKLLLQYFNNSVTAAQNMIINSSKLALDNYIEIQKNRNKEATDKDNKVTSQTDKLEENMKLKGISSKDYNYIVDALGNETLANRAILVNTASQLRSIVNKQKVAEKMKEKGISDEDYGYLVDALGSKDKADNAILNKMKFLWSYISI